MICIISKFHLHVLDNPCVKIANEYFISVQKMRYLLLNTGLMPLLLPYIITYFFCSESIMTVGPPAKRRDDDDEEDSSESIAPPDGGWGWMVVFGSFMIHVISKLIIFRFLEYCRSCQIDMSK